MKEAKWLYRLEAIESNNGLWYNSSGNYVFGINDAPNCSTKELPMGYDERYKQEGKDWFSSCSKIEDLTKWFSIENVVWLLDNGYVFTKYLAVDYHEYEFETVFLKETAIKRTVVSLEEVFGNIETT